MTDAPAKDETPATETVVENPNVATKTAAVEVPKASPEENAKADAAPRGVNKRPLLIMLAVIAIAAIIVAIAVPIASRNSVASSKSMAADENAGSSTSSGGSAEDEGVYESIVLLEKLPMFTPEVLQGYETYFEFEQAVATAAMTMAEEVIARNIQNLKSYQQHHDMEDEPVEELWVTEGQMDDGVPRETTIELDADMAMEESAPAPMASMAQDGGSPGGSAAGVTEFETNNQEESVDEADEIKADANFVYAAYGDYILVWDTKGNKVAQVAMPVIPGFEEEEPEVEVAESKLSEPRPWTPKPRVRNMMLTDNHLIVIVEGYGPDEYRYMLDQEDEEPVERVLSDYRKTQIRLYEKTESGDLTFVGKKDVNGYLLDARSMGDNVHIATTSSMNVWTHLHQPLDPPAIFKNADKDVEKTVESYEKLAREKLLTEILPAFTRQLRNEISFNGQDLPSLLQINQWSTIEPNATKAASDDDMMHATSRRRMDDVMNTLAQVTSFSVADALNPSSLANDPELKVSASAYFCPASYGDLYGTEGHLVLATRGWNWNPRRMDSDETTYLVALKVDGPTTQFISVGALNGTMLNQYAMDIVGNELRVATTVRNNQGWWGIPEPMPMIEVEPMPVEEVMSVATTSSAAQAGDATEAISESQCRAPAENDECETEDSYNLCLEVEAGGCNTVVMTMNCPPTYFCVDEPSDAPPSTEPQPTMEPLMPRPSTENYMIVLEIESEAGGGLMTEKGRVQIGEPGESITAVRFFDNIAYAVTFERTDPFYVLDMSVPKVLGELKLPGFSNYLHPMNDDNTMLLAVGQNATEEGRVLGLMVTVFDSTDPVNPKVLVSHTFTNSEDAYSGSSVDFDYKAFRYLRSIGKLIIPVSIYYPSEYNPFTGESKPVNPDEENFDGFSVMDVGETTITEAFRVSHKRPEGLCRYCDGGWLPTRSFVYDGNLMTVRDNMVISTSLDTAEEQWNLYLTVDGVPNECCYR